MTLLLNWLMLSVVIYLTTLLVPGIKVRGFWGAVVAAAIYGVLNTLIGWLIFTVIAVATLGLGLLLAFITRWIVNAILLKVTDALTDRLSVQGAGAALLGAAVMSALGTLAQWLIPALR
ncbi:MAG: phage holin family protein [Myxococcales bacterium]|nr:phage holin family protein [Myxococcales bacterium]